MPKGGKREGAGRPKGIRNKLTTERSRTLGEIAKEFTEEAISVLAAIMGNAEEPAQARVSAANSLLDRGWGKALVSVEVGAPGEFDGLNLEEKRERAASLTRQLGLDRISPRTPVDGNA